MVLYLRGLARPSQRLSSVSKSLRRAAHGFSGSPVKTILRLVDSRIPARFALVALSDDRGENGAQPVSKTDIFWAGRRAAIDALQSLDN